MSAYVAAKLCSQLGLSGDLVSDALRLSGLTQAELAEALGVSERWLGSQPPESALEKLEALRDIGLILAGGLDAAGVRRWLQVGAPSRLQRLGQGQAQSVLAEAQSYLN